MFCDDDTTAEINLECAYHMVLTYLVKWHPLSFWLCFKGKIYVIKNKNNFLFCVILV